ncbi:hypothetical protein [Lamprobacter modestohalophilus]|uniref:hypothetical protein n=1 Tax=Lamprobacter modestohalophilus TaxID=1064514 RepID=UPI001F5B6DC2|nr:hypothetical protein [Lamprobacter modestohalophilus]
MLTSTFANRNNYATYAGLGILAALALMLRSLRQCLAREAEPETDGREGLKSLELLIAAYLSARDGGTVSLPLEY